MQFKDSKKKKITINITSLIDVMFILIIFFMVSSSFVEQPGMKLELPKIKSTEVARVENLAIFITKEGDLFINDVPVPLDSFSLQLHKMIPDLAEKTLILKADRAARHGLIVQIMDIAKRNGLEKIVIGTDIDSAD